MSSSFENENAPDHQDVDDQQISATNTRNDCSYASVAEESILVISYQDLKLGLAFYRVGSPNIELLHEMYEFNDFMTIRLALRKFAPTHVVASSHCGNELFYFLEKYSSNLSGEIEKLEDTISEDNETGYENRTNDRSTEDPTKSSSRENEPSFFDESELDSTLKNLCPYNLQIIPSKSFNYDQCKSRILSLNLPKLAQINDSNERFIFFSSMIDFAELNTIKSLGVLLPLVEKRLIKSGSISEFQFDPPTEFVFFDLEYFVSIDQVTYEALDIFQNEWHPSISRKGMTSKKESFTLFGIFNTCASRIGSLYLRKIFLQPITDSNLLQERLDIIDFFTKPVNSNLRDTLRYFLKNMKDVSKTIGRLRSMNITISDFKLLDQTLKSVIPVRNMILNFSKTNWPLKIFEKICKQFTKELDEINQCIDDVIDFKKSKDDGKIMIKKGIDDELDQLKFCFNRLPEILKIAVNKEDFVNELRTEYDVHLTIIYVPQLGFLLKMPITESQKIDNFDKYEFDFIFCANDAAYYKNPTTIEFDRMFGDILSEIYDRTQEVLVPIKDYILDRIGVLCMAVNTCAFLDAMIAMAKAAIDYNFVRPVLTCYGKIRIHCGRHPLYELICPSFVPNDYYSDNQLCKGLILFGPNGSGKTVYLKQVCLIVYLAHIGSYVPAKYAEITIVDKIFTRIRTPESISTQLSSFKHDLNQIIAATKYARRRSLVVIDLFGKSTLHSDGCALLEACIHYWITSHHCPHLIVSTQFRMMVTKFLEDNQIQCYQFEILDTTTKTFRLKPCKRNEETLTGAAVPVELLNINEMTQNDDNLGQLVRALEVKQKTYLELADLILNTGNVGENPLTLINEKIAEVIKISNE